MPTLRKLMMYSLVICIVIYLIMLAVIHYVSPRQITVVKELGIPQVHKDGN